jgi:hypothetical protein
VSVINIGVSFSAVLPKEPLAHAIPGERRV